MVSIPAAYTATEIATALKYGADYIKIFPADQITKEYVKAITAPLSDAKLLAVGGVTAENAKSFLDMGFYGIGVGSNLYNKHHCRRGYSCYGSQPDGRLRYLHRKYVKCGTKSGAAEGGIEKKAISFQKIGLILPFFHIRLHFPYCVGVIPVWTRKILQKYAAS